MEKVVNLFKAFRANEIPYEELFGALTRMLSEEPQFSGQAVAALDSAQQLAPIPVADFIRLRNQLESTAQTFQQQDTSDSPSEAEETKIFSAADMTIDSQEFDSSEIVTSAVSADDPTLMTAPEPTPAPAEDDNDEATVIMPMPPRGATASSPPLPEKPAPVAIEPHEDEHATLIAAPSEATDSGAQPEVSSDPTMPPASLAPGASAAATGAAPPGPASTKKPPIAIIGAGAAVIVVLVVVLVWPNAEETTSPIEEPVVVDTFAEETRNPQTEDPGEDFFVSTDADADSSAQDDVFAPEPPSTPTTQSLADDPEPPSEATDTFDTLAPAPATESVAEPKLEPEPETEPEIKDESYYYSQIEKAVAANQLSPAETSGTATYYLVELLELNQHSDKVSDARAMIAKKHLELAKAARTNSRWDEAQQHLDDAFKVRLPDSYLPE